LSESYIPVPEARTIPLVALVVGSRTPRGIGKGALVRDVCITRAGRGSEPATSARAKGISDLVAPGGDTSPLRIQGSADLEGMAGLGSENAIEFKALHNPAECSMVQV